MTNSIKSMIKAGVIKRPDGRMEISPSDVHAEPGFNERIEGPELEASITELADYIIAGGMVPALEVRARDGGGVWIVDGHRRHRAYLQAIERGAPIQLIQIRPFVGNDVDRVARIVSSNTNRPLSPLEVSRVYARLRAYGLTTTEIAIRVGRSRASVDGALALADSDHSVQAMVAGGTVSATTAIKVVREHGEKAATVLEGAAKDAANAGKTKIRPKAVSRRPAVIDLSRPPDEIAAQLQGVEGNVVVKAEYLLRLVAS